MRMRHLIWINRAALTLFAVGVPLCMLAASLRFIDIGYYFYPIVAYGAALVAFRTWFLFGSFNHPRSPLGEPVAPSGIWVREDTRLDIGTPVLALWGDRWWRGVIVGFESADAVTVRYRGWSAIWDETHRRTALQLMDDDEPPDGRIGDSETAVRVDARAHVQCDPADVTSVRTKP